MWEQETEPCVPNTRLGHGHSISVGEDLGQQRGRSTVDTFFETIRARQASEEDLNFARRNSRYIIRCPKRKRKKPSQRSLAIKCFREPGTWWTLSQKRLTRMDLRSFTSICTLESLDSHLQIPSRSTSLHSDLSPFVPNPFLFERQFFLRRHRWKPIFHPLARFFVRLNAFITGSSSSILLFSLQVYSIAERAQESICLCTLNFFLRGLLPFCFSFV